jgi:hypothetical protein
MANWNLLENNVKGILATGITAVATAMTITWDTNSKEYPEGVSDDYPMYLNISNPFNPLICEIVKVTDITGGAVAVMERAQRGTDARAWIAGSIVSLNLQAQDITEMRQFIDPEGNVTGATVALTAPDTATSTLTHKVTGDAHPRTLLRGSYLGLGLGTATPEIALQASSTVLSFLQNLSTSPAVFMSYNTATQVLRATGEVRSEKYSFDITDTDTYIDRPANDTIRLILGNLESWRWATAQDIRTHYLAGVTHNQITHRAARGTSAAPAYLADEDLLALIEYMARDGVGTWGEGALVKVRALGAHDAGETGAQYEIWATPEGDDDAQLVASFKTVIYAPGVLDIPFAEVDTRLVTFAKYGSNSGFGYVTDILAGLGITIPDGASVFDFSNAAPTRMHIGADSKIYFGGHEKGVGIEDTWRVGTDAADELVIEQLQDDGGGAAWTPIAKFDADTLVLEKPVYNDINFSVDRGKVPGANFPNWAAFRGGDRLSGYQFDVDEYLEIGTEEILHDYKEGTDLLPHAHVVLSAATASEQKLQLRLHYSIGNTHEVMSAQLSVDGEITIPNATAQWTHLLVPMTAIAGANIEIGAQIKCTIERIDKSAGGTELVAEPFIISVGLHYQIDTLGSRSVTAK